MSTAKNDQQQTLQVGQIVRIMRPDRNHGCRGRVIKITEHGDCTVRLLGYSDIVYHQRWLVPGSLF